MYLLRARSLGVLVAVLAAYAIYSISHTHLFLSVTPSMQTGIYWLAPGQRAARGDIAIACVPEKYARWALSVGVLKPDRRCNGAEPVVKRVVAVGGDRVAFKTEGVYVNGVREVGSARLTAFRKNTNLPYVPETEERLKDGELLLLGDRRDGSWDGRYFGPTSRVLGRAAMIVPL